MARVTASSRQMLGAGGDRSPHAEVVEAQVVVLEVRDDEQRGYLGLNIVVLGVLGQPDDLEAFAFPSESVYIIRTTIGR